MGIVGAIAVPHPPLIVPSVGRGEQLRIQKTIDAYRRATRELLSLEPDYLVVASPHAPLFRDAFHVTTDPLLRGSMSQFRAPAERIEARCDTELATSIIKEALSGGIMAIGSDYHRDDMDHATYVPLHFVREAFHGTIPDAEGDLPCPIVRIGLSGLGSQAHREFGRAIAQAAEKLNRRVGFVASGDLSHKLLAEGPYGYAPEGPVFDKLISQIFASGDLEALFQMDGDFVEAAAECGLRSFQIMAGAIEGLDLRLAVLSNEGPFGVGYGVFTCMPRTGSGSAPADEAMAPPTAPVDPHVALARTAVETYVSTGKACDVPANAPSDLTGRRAGAFVSLHSHGRLRGCIGTIAATCDSLAREIIQNGISACSRDPRFAPVEPGELDFLEYSVDVLGVAEPVGSPAELDPKRYGVIVTKGRRRGLLLPDLDGIDTVEEQLAIARQKAGIGPDEPGVSIERFEVERHTAGGKARRQAPIGPARAN